MTTEISVMYGSEKVKYISHYMGLQPLYFFEILTSKDSPRAEMVIK